MDKREGPIRRLTRAARKAEAAKVAKAAVSACDSATAVVDGVMPLATGRAILAAGRERVSNQARKIEVIG